MAKKRYNFLMEKKVALLIPAFNCEKTIGDIIKISKNFIKDILVVSDGSKDSTVYEALKGGADVLVLKENQGKGMAVQKGLGVLLSQKFDGILFMDGDGQHSSEKIPEFLELFENYDLIIGVRNFKLNNYPAFRRIPNYIGGLFLKGMTGFALVDYQCGFRLASTHFLRKIPPIFKRYEIESQMLIIASHLKIKTAIIEVDVLQNSKSYFKAVKDTFLICLNSLDLYYERKKTKEKMDPLQLLK